ncbi:ABC transporter substrate-binding protein [Arvimicrobium flavum]|uniref:ABC transporter substrate-binding protein n=1 Tax=Arvimicrobium flavum TaxID=3393320 RepID=UPI00237A2030|nr:extracellular solute-binding protein [Mesorhizobium shangrilense]
MTDLIKNRNLALGRPSRRSVLQGLGLAAGGIALGAPFVSRAQAQGGPLVWYGTPSVESMDGWAKQFQAAKGIAVETFRAGSIKLTQKFETELAAGQLRCSVIDNASVGIFMDWVDRGLIEKYESPEAAAYPEDIRAPGFWTPVKGLLPLISYNLDSIPAEEAPKKWEDILDPKWRGKMVIADATESGSAMHWFAAMMKHFGKDFMVELSKQDVLIRQSSGAVAETLTSGERPLSPMSLEYASFEAIEAGANLQLVIPEEGVPMTYVVMGIPKGAPNPEAGKQFLDFALSAKAQAWWQQEFHTPSMRNDAEPMKHARGWRPISEIKRIASSVDDLRDFHARQSELLDTWIELFK